jgi:REP element-mobilizing transposase RayT
MLALVLVGVQRRGNTATMASHDIRSPPSGYRALRRGRRSISGQIYLTTTVCIDRTPFFRDHGAARAGSRVIHAQNWSGDARLLAWVLMPDHVHVLLQLGDRDPLPQTMARLKSHMARTVNSALGRTGSLWQCGFHDRALRRDENVRAAARYLVANPLRAELAQHVGEYPYWNAIWLD